jgi:hypothetical protein
MTRIYQLCRRSHSSRTLYAAKAENQHCISRHDSEKHRRLLEGLQKRSSCVQLARQNPPLARQCAQQIRGATTDPVSMLKELHCAQCTQALELATDVHSTLLLRSSRPRVLQPNPRVCSLTCIRLLNARCCSILQYSLSHVPSEHQNFASRSQERPIAAATPSHHLCDFPPPATLH